MKFGKQDKGVAGLTILLSLVVFLFVIGLLVMIFSLMGGSLGNTDAVTQQYTSGTLNQNGTIGVNFTGDITLTTCDGATIGAIKSIVVQNSSLGTVLVGSGNWTTSGCVVTVATTEFNNTYVNFTYDYTYAGASFSAINDTTSAISDVTDWFSIFIVIGAMVVLILLTVIIITAIRGSGLIGGQTA